MSTFYMSQLGYGSPIFWLQLEKLIITRFNENIEFDLDKSNPFVIKDLVTKGPTSPNANSTNSDNKYMD
jgi:hypothetical protein